MSPEPQLDEWARLLFDHWGGGWAPIARDGVVIIRVSSTAVLRLWPADAARLVAHLRDWTDARRKPRAELALCACEALAQAVEMSRRNAAELEEAQ